MQEITRVDFLDATHIYAGVLLTLPLHIQQLLPYQLEEFLHPHKNYSSLGWFHSGNKIKLSPDAYTKIKIILGPHPATMLRVWVLKHYPSDLTEIVRYGK